MPYFMRLNILIYFYLLIFLIFLLVITNNLFIYINIYLFI
jgi:energy-coupling factor transporter transmembrane protein EcfT